MRPIPRGRYQLWPNPSPRVPRPWPDCSVCRVVDVTFPLGHAAVTEFVRRLHKTAAGRPGAVVVVQGDSGWLVCTPADAVTREDEWRLPCELHLHRFGRPRFVEVVLAPWSAVKSELRLELRSRRGLKIPPRYFTVAHAVMDKLRGAVETQVENLAPDTLSDAAPDRPLAPVIRLAEARGRHRR